MNLKLMNTKTAILVLAFMMADAGSALAGTVLLTGVTGNSCSSYTGYSADSSGNLTVTCSADTGPAPTPTAAPTCTLTASPATISAGASSMLIANCSPAATSYVWVGTNFTGSAGNVYPASTTTYSVTGTNGVGTGNTASADITVTAASSTPNSTPGTRTVPPTSQSPLSDIRTWNYAFETINYIPHNGKVEPVGYMAYLKVIQAGKPTQIHLPNPW